MKEKIKHIIFALSALLFFAGCGKGDDPVPDVPEWNKNRTAVIQVYTRMNNTPVTGAVGADADAISSRIRSTVHAVALLDRADVTPGATAPFNPVVAVGASAKKVPLFALNRYEGSVAIGSGVLIGHSYIKSETLPTQGGTSLLKVDTRVNASIPMTFATIAFDAENQLNAGGALVRSHLNDATVVVGFVPGELAETLKAVFPAQNYRFEIVKGADPASRAIFVVSTKKWILRETTSGKSGSVSYFDLQIESL